MHFIVVIQSLLVLSWWFALGSITFLVVSNFNYVITGRNSSNSASIFVCFASCMTEPCVSCLLNLEQISPNQDMSRRGPAEMCCRYVIVVLGCKLSKTTVQPFVF